MIDFTNTLYMFGGMLVGLLSASLVWQVRYRRLNAAWAEFAAAAVHSVAETNQLILRQFIEASTQEAVPPKKEIN